MWCAAAWALNTAFIPHISSQWWGVFISTCLQYTVFTFTLGSGHMYLAPLDSFISLPLSVLLPPSLDPHPHFYYLIILAHTCNTWLHAWGQQVRIHDPSYIFHIPSPTSHEPYAWSFASFSVCERSISLFPFTNLSFALHFTVLLISRMTEMMKYFSLQVWLTKGKLYSNTWDLVSNPWEGALPAGEQQQDSKALMLY